jgi:two-component system chemotaxis sensor kinase CheA
MKPEFADLVDDFNEESSELLDAMEESLLDIQENGMSDDTISAVFRAAHTIKGAGGLFELEYLVKFTHIAENLLDEIRNHKIPMSEPIVNLYFEVKDQMQALVDWAVAEEEDPSGDLADTSAYLMEQLNFYLNGGDPDSEPGGAPAAPTPTPEATPESAPEPVAEPQIVVESEPEPTPAPVVAPEPTPVAQEPVVAQGTQTSHEYGVVLKFVNHSQSHGIDPLEFIKTLKNMGEIHDLKTDASEIPDLLNYSTEDTYLKFEFHYISDRSQDQIRGVFDVAKEYVEVTIDALGDTEVTPTIQPPTVEISIGEPKVNASAKPEPTPAPAAAPAVENESVPAPEEAPAPAPVEEPKVVYTPPAKEAPKKPTPKPAAKEKEQHVKTSATLRVEAYKIDTLINLIGEMVIANSNVVQKISDNGDKELMEAVSVVTRMLEELREASMQTRMVPIGETFSRFKRIVRDLSKELGKDIDLDIIGGDTELDKTVTEKISDPLIHLVRNSLDHGIEMPDVREGLGKEKKGNLTLKAFHESGSIAIQIIDDGKGLDPEVLKAKAIEKGVLEPDTTISDKEALNLIMAAGFSTAEKVSNISGRGVGMDVVRRNIEELRGSIELDSSVGVGTTITIRLPLTLAIIDGFLVKVGGTHFVVPLEMIVECIELTQRQIEEMRENNYINLRGSLLPLVDLREYFETEHTESKRENIVIVRFGQKSVGLIVNELHGEFQTVIKPMGAVFKNVQGVGGATILGSGEVAMILDIPILLQSINKIGELKEL